MLNLFAMPDSTLKSKSKAVQAIISILAWNGGLRNISTAIHFSMLNS
jgi:hypothetical protein